MLSLHSQKRAPVNSGRTMTLILALFLSHGTGLRRSWETKPSSPARTSGSPSEASVFLGPPCSPSRIHSQTHYSSHARFLVLDQREVGTRSKSAGRGTSQPPRLIRSRPETVPPIPLCFRHQELALVL